MRAWLAAALLELTAAGCMPAKILVEAHRGGGASSSIVPENTLPAFRAGEQSGADVLEMDAHLLADGALAILHDDTLDRTTDARGCIGARSRGELASIDAARGTPLAGTGVRVPTLDEVLAATSRPIDLELKRETEARCPRAAAAALATALLVAVDAAHARPRLTVSSFDREVLSELHALAPELPLALLSDRVVPPDEASALGVHALSLDAKVVDREVVDAAHGRLLEVRAWTVDDPATVLRLDAAGVDRIITDDPAMVRRLLASRSRSPRGLLRLLVVCTVIAVLSLLARRRSRTPVP